MRRLAGCVYLTLAVFFSLFIPLIAFIYGPMRGLIGRSDEVFYLAVSFTASIGLSTIVFIDCVIGDRR